MNAQKATDLESQQEKPSNRKKKKKKKKKSPKLCLLMCVYIPQLCMISETDYKTIIPQTSLVTT